MKNPFLQKICPPDWSAMTPESAETDILFALEQAKANLEKIKKTENCDYFNTVRALDRAMVDLTRSWTYLNHLQSVADTPQLREVLNKLMPIVTDFYASVPLDEGLYRKIKEYSSTPEAQALTGYQRRLLDETLLDFELNGAGLPDDLKSRLRDIETKLCVKTQKFSENVLDDTKEFYMHIQDVVLLKGLPQSSIDVAAKKAAERNLDGWVFTLEQPSYVPFMSYAKNDALREKIWRASARLCTDGKFNNLPLIREILDLRLQKAKILKHENFADVVLCRRMAKTAKTALKFVEDLHTKFKTPFEQEWNRLIEFANPLGELSGDGTMIPWRTSYLSEKLRRKLYDFDPEVLRPYFTFDSVLKGLFEICHTLFGLKIKKYDGENKAWDKSVDLFEIRNESNKLIGLFYTDFVPRKSKRAGAWMNLLSNSDGSEPALGVIAGNLSEPVGDKPALLSYDDVETLFHEFGHLIHFFFMDCPEFGLRNVPWDFVELPSQIMENWCRQKDSLDIFARHWQTGEPIPDSIFFKFKKSRKFMGANASMRQLSFAKIDLDMHIDTKRYLDSENIEELAKSQLRSYTHKYSESVPSILPRFTHLFGDSVGYAAGYYSYKWAEVLDADAFTRFEKEGLLNETVGRDFVNRILRVGNTIEASEAFRNFMGRDPDAAALVARTIDSFDTHASDNYFQSQDKSSGF